MTGVGSGLAALAFWGFIAAVTVAGIWGEIRKREAKQKTIQKLVESSDKIDADQIEKLIRLSEGGSDNMARDLKIGGLITLFVAPGIALFGWMLGHQHESASIPLFGVSLLMGCISIGLLTASWFVAKSDKETDNRK